MAESRFVPEVRAGLLECFAAGMSVADAAQASGVNEKTLKSWLTRGRKDESGEFADFVADVEEMRKAAKSAPGEMDDGEFRGCLELAVRRGSVQAMKLWSDLFLAPTDEPEKSAVDEFDELAARRAQAG